MCASRGPRAMLATTEKDLRSTRTLTARPLPHFTLPQRGLYVSVDPTSPLRPQLNRLEDRIEESLDEVCDSDSVKKANTGELIKIEETLAIAAEAAKEAVSVRRRMRQDRERPSGEQRPEI